MRSDLCEDHIESLWIELFPKSKRSMLFCCVYHPPSQYTFLIAFWLNMSQLICNVLELRTILGDVNADLLKPSLLHTKSLLFVMKQLI